jgi:H+-translocating NAD(P) transhydrogenase subunit alpha
MHAPMPDFGSDLYVFLLAAFLGLEVIKRVSPLLHTPLMSLTNSISAISVLAAIEICGLAREQTTPLATVLATLAVAAATTNIVGGFMITDRMLKMFKKREAKK